MLCGELQRCNVSNVQCKIWPRCGAVHLDLKKETCTISLFLCTYEGDWIRLRNPCASCQPRCRNQSGLSHVRLQAQDAFSRDGGQQPIKPVITPAVPVLPRTTVGVCISNGNCLLDAHVTNVISTYLTFQIFKLTRRSSFPRLLPCHPWRTAGADGQ